MNDNPYESPKLTDSRPTGSQARSVVYASLQPAPRIAIQGAVVWGIWVFAFYQLKMDFHLVSVPVGVAAHVFVATLYLPLLLRWYRIERRA